MAPSFAKPPTASVVMGHLGRLEEASVAWYCSLAERFPAQAPALERCAAVCGKNQTQVQRTYQETVTDALETGFAFEGLDLSRYGGVPQALPESLDQALEESIALEERAAACYEDVAARSARLLATIPRALQRAAEGRRRNAAALRALRG